MKKIIAAVGLSVLGFQIVSAQVETWEDLINSMPADYYDGFEVYGERVADDVIEITVEQKYDDQTEYFVKCSVYPSNEGVYGRWEDDKAVFEGLDPKAVYDCSATAQPSDGWVRYGGRETVTPINKDEEGNIYTENPFSDVNMNTWEGKAAVDLYHRGIVSGNPDGSFDGSRKVNRVEAAKMLILGYAQDKDIPEIDSKGPSYLDVDGNEWFYQVILDSGNMEFMEGYLTEVESDQQYYPNSYFRPGKEINTVEFLKMMVEVYGLDTGLEHSYDDVPEGIWYEKYAGAAQKYDLFPKRIDSLVPGAKLTRDEVAVAIHRYLLFKNGEQQ